LVFASRVFQTQVRVKKWGLFSDERRCQRVTRHSSLYCGVTGVESHSLNDLLQLIIIMIIII
jgi:hypothetical protein